MIDAQTASKIGGIMKLELTSEEEKLRTEIKERMSIVKKAFENSRIDSEVRQLIDEMGTRAHQLHQLLKNREKEPHHHKYMIENRGLNPDDPNFYMHYHPIVDLLKFLDDTNANDDPHDQTIGDKFTFNVFSRRWNHSDSYSIKRTNSGWEVNHLSISGPCDKRGQPFLFQNFEQDFIKYPHNLEMWMEWLWEKAASQGLTHDDVQNALNEIAEWVSNTEQNAPQNGIWRGLTT